MQVKAIYEDGRLIFEQSVRLRSKRVSVVVTLNDKDVEPDDLQKSAPLHSAKTRSLIETLRAIRGGAMTYRDDGRSDSERFAQEIREFYK